MYVLEIVLYYAALDVQEVALQVVLEVLEIYAIIIVLLHVLLGV